MSHAATYGNYYVIHNGDYSGDIGICKQGVDGESPDKYVEIARLPYWLLEEIVAAKVMKNRIAALEAMHPRDLLK